MIPTMPKAGLQEMASEHAAKRASGSLQPGCCAAGWSVKPLFAWYDFWVGIFWDSRKRKLYVLPLPCVGLVFEFPMRPNTGTQRSGIAEAMNATKADMPGSLE